MKVFSKEYFDNWLQKLFSFVVSVKMIVIVGSSILAVVFYQWCETLLKNGKINGDQFVKLIESDLKYWAAVMAVIIGARGIIQIADVIKKKTLDEVKEKAKEIDGD